MIVRLMLCIQSIFKAQNAVQKNNFPKGNISEACFKGQESFFKEAYRIPLQFTFDLLIQRKKCSFLIPIFPK